MLSCFKLRGAMALTAFVTATAVAQIHKVAPPEKVTRAVGVYEWTGDLAKPIAARIVPVSIFINGHMEDAGVYLSEPIPFALGTGVVYSLEEAGKSVGTVDLDYARNVLPPGSTADVAAIGAWYGYGGYAPLPKPKPSTLKASANVAHIVGGSDTATDDDRPHFAGKQPGDGNATPAAATTASNHPAAEDSDRPTLHRNSSTTTTASTTDAGTVPDDDPDRPTLRHRDLPPDQTKGRKQKQGDSTVIPMAASLNDDPDRPIMERGKPAGGVTAPPELHSLPRDMHQMVAVSDPANRDPHFFTYVWETHTEHDQTLARIESLAAQRVAGYIATNKLVAVAAPASGPSGPSFASTPKIAAPAKVSHRGSPAKPATPPALLDETLKAYELSYGGLPTFVYEAQSPITTGGPVYVTLVTQRLPSGEMQVAFSSVTDASHLDRTPWFRFIDAVDPDASHRASLLFELRAQSSRQFALYRLVTAHAEQQFLTGLLP